MAATPPPALTRGLAIGETLLRSSLHHDLPVMGSLQKSSLDLCYPGGIASGSFRNRDQSDVSGRLLPSIVERR